MLQPVDRVIAGVRCAIHDSDPGKREAVVFVHGNPGPMDDWQDLIPSISSFSRVVAMGAKNGYDVEIASAGPSFPFGIKFEDL